MSKIITKADIVLFVALIALGIFLSVSVFRGSSGSSVRITVDGKLYGTYPLGRNDTITIRQDGHENIITIRDDAVFMEYSDCKNQICVDTGKISKTNQSIVCLPNRVAVTITGDGGGGDGVDAISQ